jgi:hypothetical protein
MIATNQRFKKSKTQQGQLPGPASNILCLFLFCLKPFDLKPLTSPKSYSLNFGRWVCDRPRVINDKNAGKDKILST